MKRQHGDASGALHSIGKEHRAALTMDDEASRRLVPAGRSVDSIRRAVEAARQAGQ